MTLKELAHELRKIFIFEYATVADYKHEGPVVLELWEYEPNFRAKDCTWNGSHHCELLYSFDTSGLACDIDLSEYRGENGEIDYSKCIVEVEE